MSYRTSDESEDGPLFLTTREAADLLRVKERKVYELAARGEIPHRRITGKLLFPRARLLAWIDGDEAADGERPMVLTGSHDPLLDWAVRESGSSLSTRFNGSLDGLHWFAAGQAALAGLHIPEKGEWNIAAVADLGVDGCVLIAWAVRARGLIVSERLGGIVQGPADIRGRRVVRRQPGAGADMLLADLLAGVGLSDYDVQSAGEMARTESDAAAQVASGEADAALGIEAMARQYRLPFVPLVEERFDLLIDRYYYFSAPVQTLLDFARGEALQRKARSLGGYSLDGIGSVRWLGP